MNFRKIFPVVLLAILPAIASAQSPFQALTELRIAIEDVSEKTANYDQATEDLVDAAERLNIATMAVQELLSQPIVDPPADEPIMSVLSAETPDVIDREVIAQQIVEASEASDSSRFEKRRVRRVMNAKFGRLKRAKEQAIDFAASEALTSGVVVATASGVQPAVDWDAIADFFERILPLILQIIGLFG